MWVVKQEAVGAPGKEFKGDVGVGRRWKAWHRPNPSWETGVAVQAQEGQGEEGAEGTGLWKRRQVRGKIWCSAQESCQEDLLK